MKLDRLLERSKGQGRHSTSRRRTNGRSRQTKKE